MRARAILRIRIITAVILVFSCFLIVRLFQVQVMQHEVYLDRGEQQYVHTVSELYSRGNIYMTTREGELVSAATVQNGFVVAINPQTIENPQFVYDQLSPLLLLDEEPFLLMASSDRSYVEIDARVSEEIANAIIERDLSGVGVYRNRWRYYPGDALAARTIGFEAYNDQQGDQLAGRYGLERQYEEVLQRQEQRLSVNFFAELFSNLGGVIFNSNEHAAGHIVTTLEPSVSRYLQNKLLETQEQWDSAMTGGIIMNPQTGEIYALDAVPTFDLNDRSGVAVADFNNPLVENVYEMGSIIKPLTVAAGLDAGAITPQSTYFDAGFVEIEDYTIGNFDGRGRGYVNMQEVLNQSLNTGVAHIVDQMGEDAFRDYFINLKLGSETGIDLPNETYGLIENLKSPRKIEYATASFGQGIAMTPIETVRALATLGNGGTLVTPHLVSEIRYETGDTKPRLYPDGEQVYSIETSEEISRMLVAVVDDALRNGEVALPDHTIAAKTGTAQIANPEGGGYYDDRYLHSFFGYFPAFDPEFIVFLYTVEPKDVRYASETLTEPFMDIAKYLINYYNIPPDR